MPRDAVQQVRHVASIPTAGACYPVEEVVVFRELSAWHLVIIVAAFVLLFGYKKLPDATRSLGRSMRIFKSEVKGLHDDEPRSVEQAPAAAQPVQPVQSHVAPPAQSQPAQPQAVQPQAAPPAQSAAPVASDARAEAERS
ncbi:MAG: sec-independent protein translocase protein TatA [Frankiaceae bacterium]|jgi:sec-independent protein translocase protein TatA|nr:sec-independent protein translocase protein TatA [Frankiaceae bacterium]MDQ1636160.1 sec-independent protein translocase protein TatA [Frankiaceae bacterium]